MLLFVFKQNLFCALKFSGNHVSHFFVNLFSRCLGVGFCESVVLLRVVVADVVERIAHAVVNDHGVDSLRHSLQVVECSGGDVSDEEFFRGASSEDGAELVQHLFACGVGAFFGHVPCCAETLSSRHDGDLHERVGILQEPRDGGMSGFVNGNRAFFVLGHDFACAFESSDDSVHGVHEVLFPDFVSVVACSHERRFVADVGDVCAGEARCLSRQHFEVEVFVHFQRCAVHFEDGDAFGKFGKVHMNLTVKSSGTKQGGVQDVHAVGGCKDNDAGVCSEAVHLGQELVERVFAFVVASHLNVFAACTSDGVNFIDEDDAGRLLLGLLEEVSHAACAHADKHFDKVRASHGKERDVGFACHSLCQQCFACARRSHEEGTFGNLSAEVSVFLRSFEEIDNFANLLFCPLLSGYVFEGDVG